MAQPLFSVGEMIYLKESAEAGFLEAYKVTSVSTSGDDQWVYSTTLGPKLPTSGSFGEKITYRDPRTLYFNESELLSFCDAAVLARASLAQRIDELDDLIDSRC